MNDTRTPVSLLAAFSAPELLNLLADGAYITDKDRRILFWNRAAQSIMGWESDEVVGRTCYDNILVHVDKDGHRLCGREYCPLHRSMVTGEVSNGAMLIYALHKSGKRVPVEVTVAPIRNPAGEIIGGIELFRDVTQSIQDQMRAKKIQELAVTSELPQDDRLAFETCYQPSDLVGGDFYRIDRFGSARYAILVADVMGHGVSAALGTMLLRSLWDDHRGEMATPARLLQSFDERLRKLSREAGYFGTAVGLNYDAATGSLHCVRAGHPAPLLFRAHGGVEEIGEACPALGMFENAHFVETEVQLEPGDILLLFTDGATELFDAAERDLGSEGLVRLVREQANGNGFSLKKLAEQLLKFTNAIHLPDDLTLVKLTRRK